MFATTGASAKEIMSRGGWKSVTMVVRYEHASEERDAMLAQALNADHEERQRGADRTTNLRRSRARARTTRMRWKVRAGPTAADLGERRTKAPGERLELST